MVASSTTFSIAEKMPSSYYERIPCRDLFATMKEDGQVLEQAVRKLSGVLLSHRKYLSLSVIL